MPTLRCGIIGTAGYGNLILAELDRSSQYEVIAIADQAADPDRPTVLMVAWGRDYWGVAYAQAYRGQLEGVLSATHSTRTR